MTITAAIDSLRQDLQRYADSGRAKPAAIAFRQQVVNTIIQGVNGSEERELEMEAVLHVLAERANVAEATAELLMEWCVLHGVDHRTCLHLCDDHDSRLRSRAVFAGARAEMMRLAVRDGITSQLFTPSADRSRMAYALLLKHSMAPAAYTRHQAKVLDTAQHAVKG